MLSHKDERGSKVWRRWHAFREMARDTAMSDEQFSGIERETYDLETARITGDQYDDTYVVQADFEGEKDYDIRELKRH